MLPRILLIPLTLVSFLLPSLTLATTTETDLPPTPSLVGEIVPAPKGTTECFADTRYRFGSVSADPEVSLTQALAGTQLGIKFTLENQNPYPITDTAVFVKIFRKRIDLDAVHQNGDDLVDQFFVREGIALNANATTSFTSVWKIPAQTLTGDYRIVTFVTSSHRYNLLGLSFTDDVTGNQTEFHVDGVNRGVVWNKDGVTVAGELYRFAAFTPKLSPTSSIVVAPELVNGTKEEQLATITWSLYSWDAQLSTNLIETTQTSEKLKPGEHVRPTYTVTDTSHPVYLLVAESHWRDATSTLNIRFVRDGVDAPRINFPSIGHYPLKAGVPVELFSCLHNSGTGAVVHGNELSLTLRDDKENVLHTYVYKGDITGDMMAVADQYVPKKDLATFTLEAKLSRDGKVVDANIIHYDCAVLGGCPATSQTSLLVLVGALVALLVVVAIALRLRKNGEVTAVTTPPEQTPPTIPMGILFCALLVGGV